MKHYHELPRKDDNKTGMLMEPAMSGLAKDTGSTEEFWSGDSSQQGPLHGKGLLTGVMFHQTEALFPRSSPVPSFIV